MQGVLRPDVSSEVNQKSCMTILEIENLHHRYKENVALRGISFSVAQGEIFGLLGPNGSGKTTLFRVLSTSLQPTSGNVKVHGYDISADVHQVRQKTGIVFQSPSLDPKLTVRENLMHHGHLYGLWGKQLKKKIDEMTEKLGIHDRGGTLVEKLSGGLKRRAELAKGLLHQPSLLILDEPSTGLDPGARIDLWKYLNILRDHDGVTILLTTHLMDEAEQCHRVAILNEGHLVKVGDPNSLKKEVGRDVVVITTQGGSQASGAFAVKVGKKFNVSPVVIDGTVQIEDVQGAQFMTQMIETFPGEIESVTFRKPTLEDVFIHHTGHRFWNEREV